MEKNNKLKPHVLTITLNLQSFKTVSSRQKFDKASQVS